MAFNVRVDLPLIGKVPVVFKDATTDGQYDDFAMKGSTSSTQFGRAMNNVDMFGVEEKGKVRFSSNLKLLDVIDGIMDLKKGVWGAQERNPEYILKYIVESSMGGGYPIKAFCRFTRNGKFVEDLDKWGFDPEKYGLSQGDIVMEVRYSFKIQQDTRVQVQAEVDRMFLWAKRLNFKLGESRRYSGGDLSYMIRDILKG